MSDDIMMRIWQNRKILEARSALPMTLEYNNEFGPELICFIPTIFWLKAVGLLEGRKVKIFRGMRSFYYFLSDEEIEYRDDSRQVQAGPYPLAYLANRQEHYSTKSPLEIYPDYRGKYRNEKLLFGKPILVINNKYAFEWSDGPTNYIDLETLGVLFRALSSEFQIIYIRQGITVVPTGFSEDENKILAFDDLPLVRKHKDVILFEDLLTAFEGTYDYNTLKLMLYANCFHFITSQGGGAHQCAAFSGSLIAILHAKGEEANFAYSNGFYTYYANPSPILLVSATATQLQDLIPLFNSSHLGDNRVSISAYHSSLVSAFAPKTLSNPHAEAYRIESWYLITYGE